MQDLFTSGRIADVVLAIIAMEAIVLLTVAKRRGGVSLVGLIGNLLAGASLVVALKLALTGGHWALIAAALSASLVGHAADLWGRWRD